MTCTVTGDALTTIWARDSLVVRSSFVHQREAAFVARENIITGNVCFCGATNGEAFNAGDGW